MQQPLLDTTTIYQQTHHLGLQEGQGLQIRLRLNSPLDMNNHLQAHTTLKTYHQEHRQFNRLTF